MKLIGEHGWTEGRVMEASKAGQPGMDFPDTQEPRPQGGALYWIIWFLKVITPSIK